MGRGRRGVGRGEGAGAPLGLGAGRRASRAGAAAPAAPAPPGAHHAAARLARRAHAGAPPARHLPRRQEDPRAAPRLRLLRRTRLAAARGFPRPRSVGRRSRRVAAVVPDAQPARKPGSAAAADGVGRGAPAARLLRERHLLRGQRGAVSAARRRGPAARRRVPLLAGGLPPLLVVAPRRQRAGRRGGRGGLGAGGLGPRAPVRRVPAGLRPRAGRSHAAAARSARRFRAVGCHGGLLTQSGRR